MRLEEISVPGWEKVVRARNEAVGLDSIIAVHDASLGPGLGGCRIRAYGAMEDALDDVKRLSRAMTYKNALAGIPFGGGKAVIIADPKADKTRALFDAFAEALNALNGLYYTAGDSGITDDDLAMIADVTSYVTGVTRDGAGGNPAPFTARGVFRGIEAAAAAKFDNASLKGVRVAISGIGAVGMGLAALLHEAGAVLTVADVNEAALSGAEQRFGARIVAPEACASADVDIFSPCALGGAVRAETIDAIKASIIAGAANNQLWTSDMDAALTERGILYAPDYVINAAGVISVGLEVLGTWSEEEMTRRIDAIGGTLTRIFQRADDEGRPTGAIADIMAHEVIDSARA
ncbi:MAG: Glu/Leu/Phe/Val dehydrogenase dimerization domain-containing protein [Pseudomonadota bacterium]